MKIQTKKETHNKTIGRREFELEVSGVKTTPSRKELLEKIAAHVSQNPDTIAIQKIEQLFGQQTNRVWCRAYPSIDAKNKIELQTILGRDSGAKMTPDARKKREDERKTKKAAGKPKDAAPAAEKK